MKSVVSLENVIFRTTSTGQKQFSPKAIGHYLSVPFQVGNEECKTLWLPASFLPMREKLNFWKLNWVVCLASGAVVGFIGEIVLKKVL